MPTTTGRRSLTFSTLDQVMPEVDRLMDQDYTTVGRWTLGQTCYHLSKGLAAAVEPPPIKVPWILRAIVGPYLVKGILLKSGKMPEGSKGPAYANPPAEVDDRAEVEALRATLRLFAAHDEPFAPHPLLGPLTRAEYERLHGIHCAHHLSFLTPK